MPWITRFIASQLRTLPPLPKCDLSGTTWIITGANSGLGLEIAHHLAARRPGKLIFAVRNVVTGETAKQAVLAKLAKPVDIEIWQVDMSDYASIKAFGERCAGLERLDGVALNAGIIDGPECKYSKHGHEEVFQINTLSPILLALLLLPVLRRTAPLSLPGLPDPFAPRMVFTSTILIELCDTKAIDVKHPMQGMDDKKNHKQNRRYIESKVLLHLLTRKLIALNPSVVINGAGPGLVNSPFFKSAGFATRKMASLIGRTPEVGARNLSAALLTLSKSTDFVQDCVPYRLEKDWLESNDGKTCGDNLWSECLEEFEGVVPGISSYNEV